MRLNGYINKEYKNISNIKKAEVEKNRIILYTEYQIYKIYFINIKHAKLTLKDKTLWEIKYKHNTEERKKLLYLQSVYNKNSQNRVIFEN